MASTEVPKDLPNPSKPLVSDVQERFAQNRVAGNTLAHSWALARYPDAPDTIEPAGAKASGFRATKKPETKARIAYLHGQRRTPSQIPADVPNRAQLMRTLDRVTSALVALYATAEASGASEVELTKIKRATTLHCGRAASMKLDGPPPLKPVPTMDLQGPLTRLFSCECT